MKNNEINNILLQIDSNRGRVTKIRILRCLSKKSLNANELAVKLQIRSYSHVRKFLNILYELFLVDKDTETFSNEYKEYNRNKWFLTDLGRQLISNIRNLTLSKEITPNMFKESLKRKIRVSEEYKKWKEKVLEHGKCENCGIEGDMEAHHKIRFSDILDNEKISSLEEALKSELLFDVNNGECLCTYCHSKKHSKNYDNP